MHDRLKKQMDFILEIDKLKDIKRQTYLSNGKVKENDAEHSWHLAMMALLLSEYSNEDIDVLRTMAMVLIHDIIEIDAGDTYAYDEAGNQTKSEREMKAARRLFNILPEDQAKYMFDLWREFEDKNTSESLFANCLDKVQPTMLNDASGGKSWEEHGVAISKIFKRNSESAKGSEKLWNYAKYNYLWPNVMEGKIYNDLEELDMSRYFLAMDRIQGILNETDTIPEKYADYFSELAEMFMAYKKCNDFIIENNRKYNTGILGWYKEIAVNTLEACNYSVNCFRYDKIYYEKSFANPDYIECFFDGNTGQMLCFMASLVSELGRYCFEQRYFDITITAELFLEIYDIIKNEPENSHEGSIKSAIYYHIYDYMEDRTRVRVRNSLDKNYTFFSDIVTKTDINDERILYLYGENISYNERESFKFINALPEEKIDKIVDAYVDGYIKGFELAGIDLSKKETVQIRYPVGMERIIKKAIAKFAQHGLRPLISRGANQTEAIDTNPQFAYDHRFDNSIYYNKAVKDRSLSVLKKVYDEYAKDADVYAGPAVFEYFGENIFNPLSKKNACVLSEEQQNLKVEYQISANALVNNYIKRDAFSFTIIAFPVPEIGSIYPEIFEECILINTLDTDMFSDIQQCIINVLDQSTEVRIEGNNGNETNLRIKLTALNDPSKESLFHNCLADCNIPVGEVYTSPKLEETNGLLNVKKVYINGLEYRNLKIEFNDGLTGSYSCDNYDDDKKNTDYVRDNLMKQHKFLPMGELAIGTNTAAFKMARDYNIADKLPILIAEKTGPHIAIGDTCFSMSEEIPEYNPDGKEVIARDNSISLKRKENINEAYFGCHTDITIPYDEIGGIYAVKENGEEVAIIENGRFVLAGTEKLNEMM